MSQNPTYVPEPGYNQYDDRSGRSTPQYYSNSQSPAVVDPYTNMASYRQATSGPPDSSTGNGKSYRYATEATIPEDEDEPDTAVDAKQVQFSSDSGAAFKKPTSQRGPCGLSKDNCIKLLIIALVLVSILAVIMLALYVSAVTSPKTPETGSGNAKPTADASQQLTTKSPQTTTKAPAQIASKELGSFDGKKVIRYTLTNDNGMELEVLSLGARINRLKAPDSNNDRELVPGFDTDADVVNLTRIADNRIFGAFDGPICGNTANNLHKTVFAAAEESNGVKFTTQILNGAVDVEILYTLSDDNQVKVVAQGKLSTGSNQQNLDMCNTVSFKLTDASALTVNAAQLYNDADQVNNVGGLNDYRTKKSVSGIISSTERDYPQQYSVGFKYLLIGAAGLRFGANLEGSAKIAIQTSQEMLQTNIILDDDYITVGREQYREKDFISFTTFYRPSAVSQTEVPNRIVLVPGAVYKVSTLYTIS